MAKSGRIKFIGGPEIDSYDMIRLVFVEGDYQVYKTGEDTVLGTIFKAVGEEQKDGNYTVFWENARLTGDLETSIKRILARTITEALIDG